MLRHLKAALGLTLQFPGIIFFIYMVNLLPGVAVAGLFYRIGLSEGNGSLVLNKLLADFDYMVFTDFMRYHGNAFIPVLLVGLAIVGIYSLLTNLFTGGIFHYYAAKPSKLSVKIFLGAGWRMFGKYLLIMLMELFLLLIVFLLSGIFFFIFALIAEGGSEREYILWLTIPAASLVFMGSLVLLIGDYAKYLTFEFEQLSFWGGFGRAVSYVFRHFQTVGLYWIVITAGLLLGLVYLGVDALIGMSNVFTVILMFIIQQGVVLGRVFLKNVNYAVVHDFYINNPITLPAIAEDNRKLGGMLGDLEVRKPSEED